MDMTNLPIAAMVLAALADIFTTERFLRHGYVEENRLMRWAMGQFGRGWIVFKLVLTCGAVWLALYLGIVEGLWLGAAILTAVAVRNWRLVK